MKKVYHFSNVEKEIMEILWEKESIRQTELLSIMNNTGKNWVRQTLNTFLIRLENRGLVERKKHIVSATFSKAEMGGYIANEIALEYFGGDFEALIDGYEQYRKTVTSSQ